MKKKVLATVAAALVLIMFAACSSTVDEEHNDPAFLEGTWIKVDGNPAFDVSFTIEADLTFNSIIVYPPEAGSLEACVTGELVWKGISGLSPNDYLMSNLDTDDGPGGKYAMGNAQTVTLGLPEMEGVLMTLTPSNDMDHFVLTSPSTDDRVEMFFGGTYDRQP